LSGVCSGFFAPQARSRLVVCDRLSAFLAPACSISAVRAAPLARDWE
jgi:hypothetical protein